MDIVLNTTFLNALLPTVPLFGFADNFNRADASTLGVTSGEAKAWTIYGTGAVWSIASNRAGLTALTGSSAIAYVDGASADGTLKATLAVAGTQKAVGLSLRGTDLTNQYYLGRESGSVLKWTLYKRVAGTVTSLGNSGVNIADGDVVEAVMSGNSIIIKINGASVISATDSTFNTKTLHGFYGSSVSLDAKWDDISFVAA